MKKYKIEKLKSGHFRVRSTLNGRTYSMTFIEKPTQKEIDERFHKITHSTDCNEFRSFKECADAYLKAKEGILSPATIYNYHKYFSKIENADSSFWKKPLYMITQYDIQILINSFAKCNKYKTLLNVFAFINSVIRMFNPDFHAHITFPQKDIYTPYIPTDEDIKKLFSIIRGTKLEIPFTLACFGFRRGEIAGVTLDSVGDGIINISQSMVICGKDKIFKTPKTTSSVRSVVVPKYITDKIKSQGYVYDQHIGNLSRSLRKIQDQHNMPHFSLHKLRHYFASTSHCLRPDIYTMQEGGWQSDKVMKKVYTHAISDQYTDVMVKHFESLL